MKLVFAIIFLCSTAAFAQTEPTQSTPVRIYQVDSIGNKQHHKPGFVVEGNKVYQTDTVGNKQYHKPSFVVEGDKIYQTDTVGNKQYHKPSYSISQEGKRK